MSLAPFAKRRDFDREDVEPVKKVLAKLIITDHASKSRCVAAIKRTSTRIVFVLPSRSNSCS